MILPAAEDRPVVIFHVWPSLAYRARMIASLVLIVGGMILQFVQENVLPGVLLLLVGNLVLLVRGYDNRVDFTAYDPDAEWERVDIQRLEDLRDLHRDIRKWDISAMDVSNPLGAVLCILIALGLGAVAVLASGMARVLAIDAAVLLLPHWITGIRSVLVLPKLMIKIEMVNDLLNNLERDLSADQIHLLMLLKGGGTRVPDDVKFKVDLKGHHKDLLGVYGQIVANEVNGRSYPFFYVVIVARKGFGLRDAYRSYRPPGEIMAEFEEQDQVEVLVIRQVTTKTSGYHTDTPQATRIFEEGLRVARDYGVR